MNLQKNCFMRKTALLLLCVPSVTMVSLLSASVPYIAKTYSQYSETIVTMLLTIPNLSIMIGLIAGPLLLKRYSTKQLTLTGMLIFLISSVVPAWIDQFWIIFILRIITGIGCGLVVPLQETYLATYPEEERATLMGVNITVGCLVAAVLAICSGILAEYDWHLVFYLYAINIIVLLLAFIFLPEQALISDNSAIEESSIISEQSKLSDYTNTLVMYYVLLAASYICVSVIAAQIAYYVADCGFGGAAESGILVSVDMAGCLIAGLLLGQYLRIFKQFALPMTFVCSAIALLILWLAPSLVIAGIGVFLTGVVGSVVASIVNYELSVKLPLELFTIACAGSNFLIFILQFFGPILFTFLLTNVANNSFRTTFFFYAIVQAIFIIIAYLLPKILIKEN